MIRWNPFDPYKDETPFGPEDDQKTGLLSKLRRLIPILSLALLLAACGTTPQGERRAQSAGGTYISFDSEIVLADGRVIPVALKWDTGSAKGDVTVEFWHPESGKKLFKYHAAAVTQPERVMEILARVKGEIAKAQLDLADGAMEALTRGLVQSLTAGVLP